jgi:GMP synthase-like glutamine amidotransferase
MNIIILQHIKIEDPGHIKDLMIAENCKLTTIELDEGEKIPKNLNEFDAMFCMGGPMDTWMEEKYPWLIEEKKKIKEFVIDDEKPFLGFCLGCQLLGEIVGGKIVKSVSPEIGMLNVDMLEEAKKDDIFSSFPLSLKALQWHSYEVQNIEKNKNIKILASSKSTRVQIFKYKNHAYGIQFHIEVKDSTVSQWGCVPEYKSALENIFGEGALEKFDKEAKENMKKMNLYSKNLYESFKKKIMSVYSLK